MRKFTKMMLTLALLFGAVGGGVSSVKAEMLSWNPSSWVASWDGSTHTMSWNGTDGYKVMSSGYDAGDYSAYTSLHATITSITGDNDYIQIKITSTDKSDYFINLTAIENVIDLTKLTDNINFSAVTEITFWGTGSSNGSAVITEVYLEKPDDPLKDEKETLSALITKAGMYNSYAYTDASFANLTTEIGNAQDALDDEDATSESLTDATTSLEGKINALAFKEGYEDLTKEMFKKWDKCDAAGVTSTGSFDGAYVLFESTGLPYGDGNVGEFNYANLDAYDKLIVIVSAGSPRIMLNRDVADGQWSSTEAESHLIDNTKGGWSSKYFSNEGNIYTLNLTSLKSDKGFAHLNAIKETGWNANVTVVGMYLYTAPDPLASYKELLSDKISEAQAINTYAKTGASVEVLEQAISDGQDALNDVNPTQESLTAATADITSAIAGLVLKDGYVNLTTDMYHEWTGIGDGATIVGNGARSLALNTNLNQGDLLYGDVNVNWKHYAKLVNPKNLIILGTSGLGFGARTDRTENNESLTQLNVTLDGEGKGIIDLSEKTSVRINAIKRGYDGRSGIVSELLVEFKPRTVTVTAAKYATFSPDLNVRATGVTAYAAKYENGYVKLTAVTEVPAGEGVVIKAADAGNYELPVIDKADALDGNQLLVSDGSITGDGSTIFALANKAEYGVGFYLVQKDLAIPAGKVYLVVPAAAREFIGFDIEATGIKEVETAKQNVEGYFNLAGQRVAQPTKGLYIVNGKKVVVK